MESTGDSNVADVQVVVVAYRSGATLERCLDSALASSGVRVSLVVANNDPSDREPGRAVAERGATCIEMSGNVGFCAAVNCALEAGSEPYVLLLNPDARIAPDYLARLCDRMAADATIASAGGRILLGLDGGGAVVDSLGLEIAPGRRPRDIDHGLPDDGMRVGVDERFGVTAAAGLYRRSALDEVRICGEVLPESFFMYLDDVDLAWRLRLWGYRSIVDSAALAWHARSAGRGPDIVPGMPGVVRRIQRAAGRPSYVRELSWANLHLMLVRNDEPDAYLAGWARHAVRRLAVDCFTGLQDPALAVRQRLRLASRLALALRERMHIQRGRRVPPGGLTRWVA